MALRFVPTLLAAAALTASFALHAVPLAYVPTEFREAERSRDRFEAEAEPGLPHEFGASLLSEQAFEALLVSEMRTRGLASGAIRAASPDAVAPQPRTSEVAKRSAGSAREDPLTLALQQMFARDAVAGAAGVAATVAPQGTGFAEGDASTRVLDDEDIVVVDLTELREGLAHALVSVLAPVIAGEGQIRVGSGGIALAGGTLSLAKLFGEYKATDGARTQEDASAVAGERGKLVDLEPGTAIARLQAIGWNLFSHPLTLGVLIVLVAIRLLRGIASRRHAY